MNEQKNKQTNSIQVLECKGKNSRNPTTDYFPMKRDDNKILSGRVCARIYANDLDEETTRKDMEHKRLSGPQIKYKGRQDLREGFHYVRLIFSYN